MKNKHIGKIIGLMFLMFVCLSGEYLEKLFQQNMDFDSAVGYANLYSILGLLGASFISMTIPFVCRLIKGKKLSYKKGKLLCVINSFIAFFISVIFRELLNNFFTAGIGGVGAIIYYFINKWLFVEGKKEPANEEQTNVEHTSVAQMGLSLTDEKPKQHGDHTIPFEDIRLEQDITHIQANNSIETSPPLTINKLSTPPKKEKVKYCSLCGSRIDNNTKKCTGCGKQYFKGIPWKMVLVSILVLLLTFSATMSVILYEQNTKLNGTFKELNDTIQELKDTNAELKLDVFKLESENEDYYDYYVDSFEKMYWFESKIVFIEDDGSNLYHKYDCNKFIGENYWVHNVEYAEHIGYNPCALCYED